MGNVGARLMRKRSYWNKKGVTVHNESNVGAMLDQWTAFQNVAPMLPTMQFSHYVTSLEAILDYMQLPLQPARLHIHISPPIGL